MKTLLKDLLQADWGPTMRGIARALGHAVAIPAAVLIVLAQWLAFTWRRPLAGVLALVPVRRSMTYPEIQEELLRPIEFADSSPNLADVAPNLAVSSPNLTTSDLNKAGASIGETELGPMSTRMDFGMARPTPPVAPQPPAREVSDEAVAGIRALVLGLAGSTEPPAPLPPVLAPGPRRQRRDSKQPQNPA